MKALEILNLKLVEQVLNPENREKLYEAITELEDLQSRSCNECKHYLGDNGNYPLEPCSECSRFYSDKFERLEK